jgi:hypothetical protein
MCVVKYSLLFVKSLLVGQVIGRSVARSLVCAGGPGLIPEADYLNSGFHPFGVGKMGSSQYVVGDRRPLQKTANVNRPAE